MEDVEMEETLMPRRIEHRPFHLTVRVSPTHAMTVGQLRLLVQRAIEEGEVPAGIEVHWIDWSKGQRSEGRMRSGSYDERIGQRLRDLYNVMTSGNTTTRFRRVEE
jgi:hypothetical protein